ncbi:BLUF domain-containing protein [Bradyrhizobium sp. RT3a]|uniref:BLUF domain-containing protein n=1 Tax=Bradyrhizobium sp. RT3a TaxID=3156333 RepID=UPI003391D4AD
MRSEGARESPRRIHWLPLSLLYFQSVSSSRTERMEMFATWLYVSTSTLEENGNDEIASIRSTAQSRNPGLGLTGVLIFSGRHFAQFLEGPDAGLETMKASIFRDQRHWGVLTLQSQSTERRRYGRWSLAYSGRATFIDRVLSEALRENDGRKLLSCMDHFVADIR